MLEEGIPSYMGHWRHANMQQSVRRQAFLYEHLSNRHQWVEKRGDVVTNSVRDSGMLVVSGCCS